MCARVLCKFATLSYSGWPWGWGTVVLGLPPTSCATARKTCQLCPRPQVTAEESGGAHGVGTFLIKTSDLLSSLPLKLWSPASSSDIPWKPVKRLSSPSPDLLH